MKNAKRLLALVMVIAMLMSYVVIPASAAGTTIVISPDSSNTLSLPAGLTVTLVVGEGDQATVSGDGTWYYPTMRGPTPAWPNEPVHFDAGSHEITIGDQAVTLLAIGDTLKPGSRAENPAALVEGTNTAIFNNTHYMGYYYTWTAEADGALVFQFENDDAFQQADNITAEKSVYKSGKALNYSKDDVINVIVAGAVGDEVSFSVINYEGYVYNEIAACHEDGIAAHWYNEEAGKYYVLNEGKMVETTYENLAIAATEELIYVEAVEATCHGAGNIAHAYCEVCGDHYADDGKGNLVPTTADKVMIAELGATNPVLIKEVAATCHTDGNYEHYLCKGCDGLFWDEECTQIATANDVKIGATALEFFEGTDEACHKNTLQSYFYCSECDTYFVADEVEEGVYVPGVNTNIKNLTNEGDSSKLVYYPAVAPTCHSLGNIAHWCCETCGEYFIYDKAANMIPATMQEVTLPATGAVDVEHIEAKEALCHVDGNIEYYICGGCGHYFEDADCTKEILPATRVIIPAEYPVYVEEVPACHVDGMKAHWYCAGCQTYFEQDDEGNLINSNRLNLVIEADSSKLAHYAETPACHVDGMKEHWYCSGCDKYLISENGELKVVPVEDLIIDSIIDLELIPEVAPCHEDGMAAHLYCEGCDVYFVYDSTGNLIPTARLSLVIPAVNELTHFEAVEPGCHSLGNVEHWYCVECEAYYTADEDGNMIPSNAQSVTLGAVGPKEMIKVDAVKATCHTNGNYTYYICSECEGLYEDADGIHMTNAMRVIDPATDLTFVEGYEPCHTEGLMDHYYCSECDVYFIDDGEGNLLNIASKSLVIPAAYELTYVEAVAATAHTQGMNAHWYCEGCDVYFEKDDEGNYINVARLSLIIDYKHDVDHYEELPACHMDGVPEYWYCNLCDIYMVADDEGNLINTTFKDLVIPGSEECLEYVEEVPACHMNGTAAHWYCADCDTYLVEDDKGNKVPTTILSLTIEGDAEELVYVEEVPACHGDGMAAHWYCDGCENYYVADDEGNLVNTNRLSLILEGDGKLLYVAGVEATADEDGMMAHFYCDGCDCYFVPDDEGNMINTNRLNLVIPALTGSDYFVDVEDGEWYEAAVEYVYENGLMEGNGDSFAPNAEITRAEAWTILARMAGETITGETWAEDAQAWAVEAGVSDGTNGTGLITREQLVTMIWRFYGEPASEYALTDYTDAAEVSSWAAEAVAWAVENGVISGVGNNTLAPLATATRATVAQILLNYLG